MEGADRLPILGLDVPAVLTYLEQSAGHGLDDDGLEVARVVWRETEGNSFFVAEVVRHLIESGVFQRTDGRWRLTTSIEELGIPEGVRDVVGRRLARLSEDTNRVLACASVVGVEFDAAVVQLAGGFTEEVVLTAVEEAMAVRLVHEVTDPDATHAFSHGLVRATLYDELSTARRASLHRHVAEALETAHVGDLDDYLPALAHHYTQVAAPAADAAKAVEYSARAGNRALEVLAHDEAAEYFRQALELLTATSGDRGKRLDLLLALGEAQRRAGDAGHRQTLLDAAGLAEECGNVEAMARAALANNRGFWSVTGTVDAERVAALEAALDRCDAGDSADRARLMASLAVELQYSGQRDRRRSLSDGALTMARRLADPDALAHVLLARCSAIWEPSTAWEQIENTAELVAVAERLGDPALLVWAHIWRCIFATAVADMPEARRSLDVVCGTGRELGQPSLSWVAGYLTGGHLILAGRLDEAEQLAVQTRELGIAAGQPDAGAYFGGQRFQIRLEQGRLAELVEHLAAGVQRSASTLRRLLLALAYCETGRHDEARVVFQPLVEPLCAAPVDAGWFEAMAIGSMVCAHLHMDSLAGRLADLLTPHTGQVVGGGSYWVRSVDHCIGLLQATVGRFDDADAHFAAAAAIEERIGAPAWLARTQLEWARMLLTGDAPEDAHRATELLGRALATARELRMPHIQGRAAELLRA
jgi:hypothetical protein